MIEKIKKLRIESMKRREAGKIERIAYEGVISVVDTARGRGISIDDEFVLNTIKKEIKLYSEMDYDPESKNKISVLEKLLPEQLTVEQLSDLAKNYSGEKNPKDWFASLDKKYRGSYDKREAIKQFNEKIKQ